MLQKFATQVDSKVLEQLRHLAATQGRQLQALIGEALTEYLQNQNNKTIRPAILQHFQQHQAQFGEVYQSLIQQDSR